MPASRAASTRSIRATRTCSATSASPASPSCRRRSTASWSRSPPRPPAACWKRAQARGIPAAVVLSAGFGEGGTLDARADRVRAVADKGMAICGPNCFGIINVRSGAASFSGVAPKAMAPGNVALISQSGSLGNFAFGPLVRDRKLGFSHFISCGNQIGTTVEDYVDVAGRRSRRVGDRLRHRGAEEARQADARGAPGACAEEIAGVLPGRHLGDRPGDDPLAHRRARGQYRDPARVPAPLRDRAGRQLRPVRRDHRAACECAVRHDARRRGRAGVGQRRLGGGRRRLPRCRRHDAGDARCRDQRAAARDPAGVRERDQPDRRHRRRL